MNEKLVNALKNAEAVVIGVGAELSNAAGLTFTGERFEKYFGDFIEKYGFSDMTAGFNYSFETLEEAWAYRSRYIYINRYTTAPSSLYRDLYMALDDKDYFVLTANADHQLRKAGFEPERLLRTQGDLGLLQCSKPCHRRTYDNKGKIVKMLLAQGFSIGDRAELIVPKDEDGNYDFSEISMTIPTSLIPLCPVCGDPMKLNLNMDNSYVEAVSRTEAATRFVDFLESRKGKKTLFLELGTSGEKAESVKNSIQQISSKWPNATHLCLSGEELK